MKPKYEIDQEVYYRDSKYKILGIKRETEACPDFIYYLTDIKPSFCEGPWISEDKLTLDNKKHYILYRSADGLEKKDEASFLVGKTKIGVARVLGDNKDDEEKTREYKYTKTLISHDGISTTETYIYDEVI